MADDPVDQELQPKAINYGDFQIIPHTFRYFYSAIQSVKRNNISFENQRKLVEKASKKCVFDTSVISKYVTADDINVTNFPTKSLTPKLHYFHLSSHRMFL